MRMDSRDRLERLLVVIRAGISAQSCGVAPQAESLLQLLIHAEREITAAIAYTAQQE